MEKIKTPSFEAIDNISNLIYNALQGCASSESIKNSVSKKLVTDGSKIFVENYNLAIASKNYAYFTKNLI